MKEVIVYLALTAALYFLLPILTSAPPYLPLPHLATQQFLVLLTGNLPPAHPSLPLYSRIYLLTDSATSELPNRTATRLFSRKQDMTGIMYTYDSFELAAEAMSEGFMNLNNLQRFMDK